MPPLSPRTQSFMTPPTAEDAQSAFEQGFSQMAQSALTSRFPELIENVVTFKVINSDIDTGSGVGAFVVDLHGKMLHVPVVLANNQIKPLELIYVPGQDIFLPLDKNWIDELARDTLNSLGEGVEAPRTLEPDQDIRNLVVPPTTGRYAYASADQAGVAPGDRLCSFLEQAPNRVKQAFAKVLENQRVLKFAFENFDRAKLLDALRLHEKTATATESVVFLTPNDTAAEFRHEFGEESGRAWQTAAKYGFVVRDTRARVNTPIETQERIIRTTANENGFYRLHFRDGSVKLCLVLANPQSLNSTLYAGVRGDIQRYPDEYRKWVKKQQAKVVPGANEGDQCIAAVPSYVVYTEDGKIIKTEAPPVGELVHASDIVGGPFAQVLDRDVELPTTPGTGIFVRYKAGRLQGTECAEILSVTTDSKGVRRMVTYGRTIVTDPNSPTNVIVVPNGGNVSYVPPSFKFLKGERDYDTPEGAGLLTGADNTLAYLRELQKTGALCVRIHKDSADLYSIGGLPALDKIATLRAMIDGLELRTGDAWKLLEKTARDGSVSFYVVNPEQLHAFVKAAQGMPPPPPESMPPPEGAAPPEGMPPEAALSPEGMPPEGMPPEGMPPEMMAPPEMAAPPPPNPVEMAAVEVSSQLAQQASTVAQQLAEQQRDLSNQLSAIEAVKQRAAQISAEQQGLAPPSPPPGVPQQPMPGTAPEGMPPEGMPPEMAGVPPEGMPPEMAGGAPTEGPSAEEIAAQAGPPLDAAAQLNDPQSFEATAIGTMAADSNLGEGVSDYIPTLENALDSLGRLIMTLWLKEDELRPDLGEQDYIDLEKRMRTVFNNLGALILRINQTAITSRDKEQGEED